MKLYFDDGPLEGKTMDVPADRARVSITIEDRRTKTDYLYHARRRTYFTPPGGGPRTVEGYAYGYVKEAEFAVKPKETQCPSS